MSWAFLPPCSLSLGSASHFPSKGKTPPIDVTDVEYELWTILEPTVLQWIYSTISTNMLTTIMELDSNAMEVLHCPYDILQDNQNTRVVTLEQEFSNTRIKNFPKVSTYCQRLKMLSDQSRNIDTLVNNHHLVLQLIYGVPKAYRIIATLIRQNNPLPPCYQAHSMLTLVEACMAKMTSNGSHAAIHTTKKRSSDNTSQRGDCRPVNHSRSCNN